MSSRPLMIKKFGGTSVGTIERIRKVARLALESQRAGHDVVLVVSAMAGETDRLLSLTQQLAPLPDAREQDVVAATGEQVSAALVALAIQAEGGAARSLLGHQVRVLTDSAFSRARIRRVEHGAIHDALAQGMIPVVAGFQGVDPHGNLTTLGRGGSDTSAVALAAALSAEVCEIYTDVEGVYTADPRVCVSSRKLRSVSYEEMLELAALGAKVLHARSVEIAMKYKVPVHVRSTFSNETGTWIVDEERGLEARALIGLACEPRQVRIELASAERGPELAARVMELLAARNVSADMMSHVCSPHDAARTEVVFTLPERDYLLVREGLDQFVGEPGPHAPRVSRNHSKVSLVGIGIRSDPGVSARLCRALALRGIAVSALAMNELRISCLVDASLADEALRILHHEFDLAEESAPPVLEKSA